MQIRILATNLPSSECVFNGVDRWLLGAVLFSMQCLHMLLVQVGHKEWLKRMGHNPVKGGKEGRRSVTSDITFGAKKNACSLLWMRSDGRCNWCLSIAYPARRVCSIERHFLKTFLKIKPWEVTFKFGTGYIEGTENLHKFLWSIEIKINLSGLNNKCYIMPLWNMVVAEAYCGDATLQQAIWGT